MRQQGRLTDWNDDRGFGFITPLDGGATVFAHISQFPRVQRRPMLSDLLVYDVETDGRGRLSAKDIEFLAPTRMRAPVQTHATGPSFARESPIIALAYFAGLAVGGLFVVQAWMILAVALALSVATFGAYYQDKRAAQSGAWRTQESALHAMSLAGGWPGALVAQQMFRHKTLKQPFQTIFWLTVAGNIALVVLLIAAAASAAPA